MTITSRSSAATVGAIPLAHAARASLTEAVDTEQSRHWTAVARLHNALFTGLVMTMTTRRSAREAAELVFRIFRRQHHERFLPGLDKLGLQDLPAAVAAGRYHYLSNAIGGVRVEYVEESDRKAWIRYSPPRWAWQGTAICAIPGEVSRAMLLGWHAHNGVSLANPRLGFVCTKQTTDGQPGSRASKVITTSTTTIWRPMSDCVSLGAKRLRTLIRPAPRCCRPIVGRHSDC